MLFYNKAIFKNCFPYKLKKRYWYKHIKIIPIYFKRMHHLIKNGYDDSAVWDTFNWFEITMRDILIRYKKCHNGIPTIIEDYDDSKFEENKKMWSDIIDRMIFLLGEMNENTCQKENPYEDEWGKAALEFQAKYGLLGEKLQTEEERREEKEKGYYRVHFMSELDEYKNIDKKHKEATRELDLYRARCKDEFLELFSKYYYNLWD